MTTNGTMRNMYLMEGLGIALDATDMTETLVFSAWHFAACAEDCTVGSGMTTGEAGVWLDALVDAGLVARKGSRLFERLASPVWAGAPTPAW